MRLMGIVPPLRQHDEVRRPLVVVVSGVSVKQPGPCSTSPRRIALHRPCFGGTTTDGYARVVDDSCQSLLPPTRGNLSRWMRDSALWRKGQSWIRPTPA